MSSVRRHLELDVIDISKWRTSSYGHAHWDLERLSNQNIGRVQFDRTRPRSLKWRTCYCGSSGPNRWQLFDSS
jgi:hypothetical protein